MSIELDGDIITKNHEYKFCDVDFRCVYVDVCGKGINLIRKCTLRHDINEKCFVHLKFFNKVNYQLKSESNLHIRLDNLKFSNFAHGFGVLPLDAMHEMIHMWNIMKNSLKKDRNTFDGVEKIAERIESLYAIRDILE